MVVNADETVLLTEQQRHDLVTFPHDTVCFGVALGPTTMKDASDLATPIRRISTSRSLRDRVHLWRKSASRTCLRPSGGLFASRSLRDRVRRRRILEAPSGG